MYYICICPKNVEDMIDLRRNLKGQYFFDWMA